MFLQHVLFGAGRWIVVFHKLKKVACSSAKKVSQLAFMWGGTYDQQPKHKTRFRDGWTNRWFKTSTAMRYCAEYGTAVETRWSQDIRRYPLSWMAMDRTKLHWIRKGYDCDPKWSFVWVHVSSMEGLHQSWRDHCFLTFRLSVCDPYAIHIPATPAISPHKCYDLPIQRLQIHYCNDLPRLMSVKHYLMNQHQPSLMWIS